MYMLVFDAASAVNTAMGQLTTDFGTVAPIVLAIALLPFGVKCLLRKGKGIAS